MVVTFAPALGVWVCLWGMGLGFVWVVWLEKIIFGKRFGVGWM